jgi:NAD(P)-dependent dehydrogenase (short-subunit alcohol dehydrogenase family)
MDSGPEYLRRAVRESADRLDVLLRRLELHVEAEGDERPRLWAKPFVPALSRELDGWRRYGEELGAAAPGSLARSVAGLVGEAAQAVLGANIASYETVAETLRAARDVHGRLDVLRHTADALANARLAELCRSLGPEVTRLLAEGEALGRQLFLERARP